jgi:hemerythrin superfamily protein
MTVTKALNVIDLLEAQHLEIRELMRQVSQATDHVERLAVFDQLQILLSVHETAEEKVLRPAVRDEVPDGGRVADARCDEEDKARQALSELETVRDDDQLFLERFESFRVDVDAHASKEETEEFPQLRESVDDATLAELGDQVQHTEATTPIERRRPEDDQAPDTSSSPVSNLVDRVKDTFTSDS